MGWEDLHSNVVDIFEPNGTLVSANYLGTISVIMKLSFSYCI